MEDLKVSIDTTSSFENIMLCKDIANTTVHDYYVNLNDISYKNSIFENDHVEIFEAEWRYERVCVKVVDTNSNMLNELSVLCKCIHPKIVQFLGFNRKSKKTSILFEYMENGNLAEYLQSNQIDELTKLNMILDITKALHYLHNRRPDVILHRDIKPSNILVDIHGNVKLSDFGISKLVETQKCLEYKDHSPEKGTYIWMAPEVLKGEEYNTSADIFSLGMLIHYIWTNGKDPYESENVPKKLSPIQLMFKKFNNSIKIKNINDSFEINDIVYKCTTQNKAARPDTNYIINHISNLYDRKKIEKKQIKFFDN